MADMDEPMEIEEGGMGGATVTPSWCVPIAPVPMEMQRGFDEDLKTQASGATRMFDVDKIQRDAVTVEDKGMVVPSLTSLSINNYNNLHGAIHIDLVVFSVEIISQTLAAEARKFEGDGDEKFGVKGVTPSKTLRFWPICLLPMDTFCCFS